jgi:hypothetical protein
MMTPVIVRFASDRHSTRVRLWFADDAFVIAAGASAALVLADRPLTAQGCEDLATVLAETAAFLKGRTP